MANKTIPSAYEMAQEAFREICKSFPNLQYDATHKDSEVDLELTIRKQEGLKFNVHLTFQDGDELILSIGDVRMTHFPSSHPDVVKEFIGSACGILSGKHRILECLNKNGKVINAKFQEPSIKGWKTVSTYSCGWDIFGLGIKNYRVVQNVSNLS